MTTASPARTAVPASQQREVLAFAATGTAVVLVAFTAPLSILPATARGLGAGTGAQTWVLSGMSLGLAAALLVAGSLGDELGRRRVFVLGSALLGGASVLCATAATPLVFVVGRVLEGVGGAAVVACSLGLVGHAFSPGPARARAAGIWGAAVGAGIAAGPLLAAGLDALHSWRDVYWALALASFTVAALARTRLDESRAASPRRLDLLGMALLAGSLVSLLVGLVEGRTGWSRLSVVAVLGAAVVLAVAFVVVERRSAHPMLDLRLFAAPAFFAVTVAALVTGLTVIALMSYLPTVVQRGLGHTGLTAAVLLLLWSATSVVTALAARRLPSRLSGRWQLAGSLVVVAVGEALLTRLGPGTSLAALVPGLLVAGAGSGVLNAALGREAVASVPADRAAMGSGANNTARYLGSAIGVTLVAVVVAGVVAARADAGTTAGLLHGWNTVAAAGAAVTLVGAIAVALRRTTP